MARSTTRSSSTVQQQPQLADIVAAVMAAMGTTTEQPAAPAKQPTRAKQPATRAKQPAAPRRVKTENLDNPASQKQVMGAFFEAFQVIYGEKLSGWPTRGDMEAIRDDLQNRLSK